jgi:hypothetical protein
MGPLMKKLSMFLPLFIFTCFVVFIFFSVSFRQLWRSACSGRSHFLNSHLEQWKRRQPIRGKETPWALSLIGDNKIRRPSKWCACAKKKDFTRAVSGAPVRPRVFFSRTIKYFGRALEPWYGHTHTAGLNNGNTFHASLFHVFNFFWQGQAQ